MRVPEEKARAPAIHRVIRALFWLVPLGVLGNLAFTMITTERAVLPSLATLSFGPLLIAGALALVPWFTNALRLMVWTHFLGYPVSFGLAFRVVLGSILGSAATPTATGGGFIKWGILVRGGLPPGTAASVISLEFIEDTLFFLIAVPLAIVVTAAWELSSFSELFGEAASRVGAVSGWIALGALLLGLLLAAAWRGWLTRPVQQRVWHAWRWIVFKTRRTRRDARQAMRLVIHRGRARLALNLALAAVQWTARYSVVTAVALFLGVQVKPVLYWLLQWVLYTVLTFVPTPGASGGAEAGFFLLYKPLVPDALLGLTTATWRLVSFYAPLMIGAVVFLLIRPPRRGQIVRRVDGGQASEGPQQLGSW